ncbi:flavodoxin [Limosilactobacillus frumenti DSM 13145]|uniref:Flavodoxin n=1 Tax=Limosilactobacillus frumenti DSM 13145 TaxID=1423746 RepID=A0A0R1PAI8_9LACO|nr:flavodoxin [Limosilactobacillus frumenti]KRL27090.1 flavodoxin [Limosilactobacillus frumenti DSM 13145]MBA2913780.1 flavodoxin [Limosilactobacillus frumenti]QFG72562.1 flavodoxin [Limosilactobacillus frumenti]
MAQNVLILYYSQFNNTAKLATKIQQATGADILRIKVAENTFPDDMTATDDLYKKQRSSNQLPTLTTKLPPLSGYDVILIGGPVWDGQISSPIMALLNQIQGYQGQIAPFSSGWSDTGNYQQDFIAHAGKLRVAAGYHVLTHATPKFALNTLSSWLRKL